MKRRFLNNGLSVLCPNGHGVQPATDVIDLADDFVNHKYTASVQLACACEKDIEVACREKCKGSNLTKGANASTRAVQTGM